MSNEFSALLDIPGKWSSLVIAVTLVFWICCAIVDRTKIKVLAGYIGGFGIGFVIIQVFMGHENAQPLISCNQVSDVVVSCNGWISYVKGISEFMVGLSGWYGVNFGASDRYMFALGVVATVFHLEIGKRPLGNGQDVLQAFLVSAGILFVFNYAGTLCGIVNGLVDSVLSLEYSSQTVAIRKAGEMIDAMEKAREALVAKDFLATALDTVTGSNGGGWEMRILIWMTQMSLGLVSIVNIGLFFVQSFVLYALPAIALFSLMIGNFSIGRVFSYIVFSSLMRVAAVIQLICLQDLNVDVGNGMALLENSSIMAVTALIAALAGIFVGIKIMLLILIREAMPAMSGTTFRIGGR